MGCGGWGLPARHGMCHVPAMLRKRELLRCPAGAASASPPLPLAPSLSSLLLRLQVMEQAAAVGCKLNEKRLARGLRPRPVRAVVIGFPNVGQCSPAAEQCDADVGLCVVPVLR